jgi:hypothetical protein
MQDLVVSDNAVLFMGPRVAIMVMDILFDNGTFRPLTEEEKATALLLVFADTLPA